MNPEEILMLAGIMVMLAALPSTSVAFVVVRSVSSGIASGLAASAGIVVADLVFVALALTGLSIAVEALGSFSSVIKLLGGCYLLWFGMSLLRSKRAAEVSGVVHRRGTVSSSFLMGLLLTFGDIKAVVFYASLFPLFVDVANMDSNTAITILVVTVVCVGGVKAGYALYARKLAGYVDSIGAGGVIRKAAGGLMTCSGGYMTADASRSLWLEVY